MKFENTEVFNMDGALRGMRNPLESWAKSDSAFSGGEFSVGKEDLDLAVRLINAGSPDRKFMRQIFVCVDITAPNYWWNEFDTYKVGTVSNSTSFMHKGMSRPFNTSMFECDDGDGAVSTIIGLIVDMMNGLREQYLALPKAKRVSEEGERLWREILQIRPSSWLYKRTVTMNYENIYSMVHQRKHHKQKEWRDGFINWARTLPYSEELLFHERKSPVNTVDNISEGGVCLW